MYRVFRLLLRLMIGLMVLGGFALGLTYYFVTRSLPNYDREVEVAGIDATIEILRTNAAVPHIFGNGDLDVYRGLGYAHSEDRLWQMIMLRRTAQGRLAELFGADVVGIDEYLRRLGLYRAAQSSVAAQTPHARAVLDAYAAGVNARLQEINRGGLGRGAPELFLFSPAIAPWQPADSIAIIKLMALQLGPHLEAEVLRARASLILPGERLRDLMPDAPGQAVGALPDYADLVPGVGHPGPARYAGHPL
ncbi:MAG: penicillin acylase family protein, partial [Pseudomonadota bacterium]